MALLLIGQCLLREPLFAHLRAKVNTFLGNISTRPRLFLGLTCRVGCGSVRAMNLKEDIQNYLERTGQTAKDLAALAGMKRWEYIQRVLTGERKGLGPKYLPAVGAIIYQRKNVGPRKKAGE